MHLLEPLAPDSLVAWGFFNAVFEQKEGMDAYVAEEAAREMMQRDPQAARRVRGQARRRLRLRRQPRPAPEFLLRAPPLPRRASEPHPHLPPDRRRRAEPGVVEAALSVPQGRTCRLNLFLGCLPPAKASRQRPPRKKSQAARLHSQTEPPPQRQRASGLRRTRGRWAPGPKTEFPLMQVGFRLKRTGFLRDLAGTPAGLDGVSFGPAGFPLGRKRLL